MQTKICADCGKEFSTRFSFRKYCSKSCYRGIRHRFFSQIIQATDGCWNWIGVKDDWGYGVIRFTANGNYENKAHRISWILHRGRIPEGLKVLHHCDNPGCCNPVHLWLGTDLDNALDKTAKGRNNVPYGEKAGSAKLKSEQVHEIRKLHSEGFSNRKIAAQFGVSHSTVGYIALGRTWKRV